MSTPLNSGTEDARKWFFTDEQLNNPPSVRLGMSIEEELAQRQNAAMLIRAISDKLWEFLKNRPNALCTCTAMVYMQRFYMYHPFQRYPAQMMAPCFLFLACKSEEQPIKLDYVIKTSFLLSHPNRPEVPEREQFRLYNELIRNENLLLQTIGFDFTVQHPHSVVIESSTELNIHKSVSSLAFRMATNSLHFSKMSLKYDFKTIAIVCLKVALKSNDLEMEPREWYLRINPKLTPEELGKVEKEFIELPKKYKAFAKYLSPESRTQSNSQQRQRFAPSTVEPTTPDSGVSSLRS